ncbi:hypothetical protein AB0392_01485 [Nonomuraea angiospora]|uniref:hypothetical protein n=1 Tax=Nonomuraea angiospora TaxID=46172 RepID=UPI00344ED801
MPGIYIWTVDFRDIAPPALEGKFDEVYAQIKQRIARPQNEALESGMVGNYRHVAIQDRSPELTGASVERLTRMVNERNLHLEWALMCATMFQRPLYVGKALNLASRIKTHVRSGSRLSRDLARLQLTPSDCTVILLPVRSPDNIAELVAAEEARRRSQLGNEEETPRDDSIIEDIEDLGDEDYSEHGLDLEDELEYDDVLTLDVSPALKQADELIRLAESLTIRLAHPLLNSRMD